MGDAEDMVAIQQLLARANTAIDGGDGPAYADCFSADGVLDMGDDGVLTGREAIAAAGGAFATAMPGLRHWVTNHLIGVTGDQATATVYVMVVLGSAEPTVAATGVYADELRRTESGWRFARRTPRMDDEPGPLQVPG